MWQKLLFFLVIIMMTSSTYSAVVQCQFQADGTCKIIGMTPVVTPFEDITVAGQPSTFVDTRTLQLYFINTYYLKFIPTKIFNIFTNLISVQITNCSTSILTTDAIMNCNNMINIQIEYGNILYVPEGFAQRCAMVRGLSLIYNNIQAIDNNAFRGLTQLQNIDLRGNRLTCLTPDVFFNLPIIAEIHLLNNLFQTVNLLLFKNLKTLRKVDLSSNLLSYIPPFDLTNTGLFSGKFGINYYGNPIKAIKSDLCTMFANRPSNVTDTYYLFNVTCQPSLLGYTPTTKLNCQTMNANFQTCFAGWSTAMAINYPCNPTVCIPASLWGKALSMLKYYNFF